MDDFLKKMKRDVTDKEIAKFPSHASTPNPVDIPTAKETQQIAAVSLRDNKKKFPERVTKVKPIAIMPYKAASLMIVLKLKIVK